MGVLGKEVEFNYRDDEAEIRNYAKHVLLTGSKDEKRELLKCLKSKLEIKDKTISLKIEARKN